MKNIFSLRWGGVFIFLSTYTSTAFAEIDTVGIYSKAMAKSFNCVVITPAGYSKNAVPFPVVYLLHGANGNFSNFVTRVPDMQQLADENKVIIVCPDGSKGSWYFDSPVDLKIRYETYISKEVPEYIDAHYATIKDRQHRAIAGLSMGGHGAIFIALRHPETFAACGSMSGAFDIPLIPQSYGIDKILGERPQSDSVYQQLAVINLLDNFPKDSLAIIIDCGAQDFISYMSKAVHDKLTKLNMPHDYTERPGRHDWNYWGTALRYQLLFFREFFKKHN